jgi:hypothetical protein
MAAMRLVIEPRDFKRLSTATQSELLRMLTGGGKAPSVAEALSPDAAARGEPVDRTRANGPGSQGRGGKSRRPRLRWREPVDLTPDLTQRLLHGINKQHKDRLRLFAEKGGRVRMRELLSPDGAPEDGVPGAADVRLLSHFEGAITRRLRRLLDDTDKVAYLIGWDYPSTQWNADHSQIVDGEYYVSGPTAACLRAYFGID